MIKESGEAGIWTAATQHRNDNKTNNKDTQLKFEQDDHEAVRGMHVLSTVPVMLQHDGVLEPIVQETLAGVPLHIWSSFLNFAPSLK